MKTLRIILYLCIMALIALAGYVVITWDKAEINTSKKTLDKLLNEPVIAQYGEEPEIGYQIYNGTLDMWNPNDHYYFNISSGVQFTNHYQDYWTHNVFCLGYYNAGTWNKIRCADELSDFSKTVDSDNATYVNATLWKDFTYGGYSLRLAIRYSLNLNDENLTVTIYGKNLGASTIPYDLGFAWIIKDVEIPYRPDSDSIIINESVYSLSNVYDITFTNITKKYTDTNITTTNTYESMPYLVMYDKAQFLRLDWNPNVNYSVKIHGDGTQDNFYSMLLINGGIFGAGVEKSTKLQWIDAEGDYLGITWALTALGANGIYGMEVVDITGEQLMHGCTYGLVHWVWYMNGSIKNSGVYENVRPGACLGMGYYGDWLWTANTTSISKYNATNGTFTGTSYYILPEVSYSVGVAADKDYVWVLSEAKKVCKYNSTNGSFVGCINIGSANTGLTIFGDYFYVSFDSASQVRFMKYQKDGTWVANYSKNAANLNTVAMAINQTTIFVGDYGDKLIYLYEGPPIVETLAFVNITYPQNTTYTKNVTWMNITANTLCSWCWYSLDFGVTNTSFTCGNNITGITSQEENNTWMAWANNTANVVNVSILKFWVNTSGALFVDTTSPTNKSYNTRSVTFNITVTNASSIGPGTCLFSLNNGVTNYSMTKDAMYFYNNSNTTMSEKAHRANFYCNATSGSTANNTEFIDFMVDVTFPSMNITYPQNTTYTSNVTVLNYTYIEGNPGFCWIGYDCYQEFTNVSTNCGGLNTGVYANQAGNTWTVQSNLYDGDWSTDAQGSFAGFVGLFINYTKPASATNAIWEVKDTGSTVNLTIPSNCFSSTIELFIQTVAGGVGNVGWYCIDSTDSLVMLRLNVLSPPNIYEEAMIWHFGNINNSGTVAMGTNFTGMNSTQGNNEWNLTCNDTANNLNSSSVKFYVDSVEPIINLTYPTNKSANKTTSQNLTANITDLTSGLKNATLLVYNRTVFHNETTVTLSENSVNLGIKIFNLVDSNYTWAYKACDNLGTCGISQNFTFMIDTTPPSMNITYPRNTTYTSNVTLLNYTFIENNTAFCHIFNGTGNSSIVMIGTNFTGRMNSSQGNNVWNLTCNDSAGNVNTSTIMFFVDSVNPWINITYPTNLQNYTSINTMNYTFIEANPDTCWWSNDSGITNFTITCGNNITHTPNEGYNNWTIWINDTLGNIGTANVTFTLDTLAPIISVLYPSNLSNLVIANNLTANTSFNFYIDELFISACWWSNDSGAVNSSYKMGNDCRNTNTSFVVSTGEEHTFTIWVNDSHGRLSSNSTLFFWNFIQANYTAYHTDVDEGSSQTLTALVKYNNASNPNFGITNIVDTLTFNHTAKASTSSTYTDNQIVYVYSVVAPSLSTTQTINFHWNFSFIGNNASGVETTYYGFSKNTTYGLTFPMTVNPTAIDNCTNFNRTLFNITMVDEETLDGLNGTVELSFYIYDVNRVLMSSFNATYPINDVGLIHICSSDFNATYYTDYVIKHYVNSTYFQKFRDVQNMTFTNTTEAQVITLYNLLVEKGFPFRVFVVGNLLTANGNQNLVVGVQKRYVYLDKFMLVESPITAQDGTASVHLVPSTEVYNFVISYMGQVLGTFNNYQVACQNPAYSQCSIVLNLFESTASLEDLEDFGNVSMVFLMDTENQTMYSTFQTTDGQVHTVNQVVYLFDAFENQTICNSTLSATSGSFICNIPATYGNRTIIAKVYSDGEHIANKIISTSPEQNFFGVDILLELLMFCTLVLLFIAHPIMIVIGAILGLLFSTSLIFLTQGSLSSIIAAVVYYLIAGGIIIWQISKRF